MRLAAILFLLCATPYCYALDVWEFALNGLDKRSALVSYTPVTLDNERALVRDAEGNFAKIAIDKFVDRNNKTVLRQCIWDRTVSLLVCNGPGNGQKRIRYEATPFKVKSGKEMFAMPIGSGVGNETITAPIEAKNIQAALAKEEFCTIPDAYFVCKENCPPNLPKGFCWFIAVISTIAQL